MERSNVAIILYLKRRYIGNLVMVINEVMGYEEDNTRTTSD